MNGRKSFSGSHYLSGLVALTGSIALSAPAFASVEKQGEWPADEKKVSLDVSRVTREDAIKRLADAAGWSVVVNAPNTDPVDIHVKDQPADKILTLLLSDTDYVAKRDGSLISIEHARAAANVPPPAPPPPPAAPAPPAPPIAAEVEHGPKKGEGKDREVVGHSLTIEKDEVVRNVHLIGGSLNVKGTVTGDVEVVGGAVALESGAHVMGDAEVMGGSMVLKKGAKLDGDAQIVGGTLNREEGAIVGGDVSSRVRENDDDEHESGSFISRAVREIGECMTAGALLFALGAVMISLFTKRSDTLKVEIASKPMRSFAMGIVGVAGGIALFIALCVTIIGIPVAVVGLIGAIFGVFAAMCATLEVVGRALIGHRTRNEYAHLAFGCALFVVAMALPVFGGIAKLVLVLVSIGSLVSTRAAGLIPPKKGTNKVDDTHPYRSVEAI